MQIMKTMMKLVFAASAIIAMLASCSKDDPTNPTTPPDNPETQTPVRIELNLEAEDMKTRAIDENSISDVNVYFYSKSNGVDYHFYQANYASAMTFNLLPGNYQLFVVTNVNKDLGEMSQNDLSLYEFSKGSIKDNIPMTANTEVNILAAATLPTLSVKRIAAKIAYSVTVDDAVSGSIKLRSIQFMRVPNTAVLFGGGNTSTDENDFYDDVTVETNNVKTYSDVYYMFENCQGNVESITDPKDKAPENAPECATYIRILADGPEKLLEYIVYLGENSTSNFDVRRNTKHSMNLYIKGENEIDNRVSVYEGLYYGDANCHICTGTQVSFDITPYRTGKSQIYAYTGIYAGKEYEAKTAGLLWQDNQVVSGITLNGNTLTVKTNGKIGNAVVAIYDSLGDILWSWHIWCLPNDMPKDDEYTNRAAEQFLVMDRNLGSTSQTDITKRYGLIYNWGRKDPFTVNKVYNSAGKYDDFLTLFPRLEVPYAESALVNKVNNIEYSIKNPTTYVTMDFSYRPYWWHDGTALWGDPEYTMSYCWASSKSVHDPCPKGYRVPNRHTWTGFFGGGYYNPLLNIGSFNHGYYLPRYKDDPVGAFYPVIEEKKLINSGDYESVNMHISTKSKQIGRAHV